MTWFGWVLVPFYIFAMICSVAINAGKKDVGSAVWGVCVPGLIIAGVLIWGTGTGI